MNNIIREDKNVVNTLNSSDVLVQVNEVPLVDVDENMIDEPPKESSEELERDNDNVLPMVPDEIDYYHYW